MELGIAGNLITILLPIPLALIGVASGRWTNFYVAYVGIFCGMRAVVGG